MWIVNEVTGQLQRNFDAKLLVVSKTVLTNTNGTGFRPATIEFGGKTRKCRIYEKNFAKGEMVVGETYQATVTQYPKDGKIAFDITLSPISNAEDANMEDFDYLDADLLAKQAI